MENEKDKARCFSEIFPWGYYITIITQPLKPVYATIKYKLQVTHILFLMTF